MDDFYDASQLISHENISASLSANTSTSLLLDMSSLTLHAHFTERDDLYTGIYTYIYSYIHTYIHILIHTYTHTYIYSYVHINSYI